MKAERKSLSPKSLRMSAVAFKTIGSQGIPQPFAIRSFLVKLAATADAADTASRPKELAKSKRALSRVVRFDSSSALEKSRSSLPPGTPISNSGLTRALRLMCRSVACPLSRRNLACPAVQKKHSLNAETLPATTSDCARVNPS